MVSAPLLCLAALRLLQKNARRAGELGRLWRHCRAHPVASGLLMSVHFKNRSAETKLRESKDMMGLHISHHEDDSRHRHDSQRLIEHLEDQLAGARRQLADAQERHQRAIEDKDKMSMELRKLEFSKQQGDKLLQQVQQASGNSSVGDTSVLQMALKDALQIKESLQANLSAAQGQIAVLHRKCHEQDESNQILTQKHFDAETQLNLLKEQFSDMTAELASADHLRARVAEMEQDTAMWQEGMAREASARRKSSNITLHLIEELFQVKREIDTVMRSVKADMTQSYDLHISDTRKMDAMKALIDMRSQSDRQSHVFVSDAISALEGKLEKTVEATKQVHLLHNAHMLYRREVPFALAFPVSSSHAGKSCGPTNV